MLRKSLKDLVKIELNDKALEALQWEDFGNGLYMSRLARAGERELVLYRVIAGSDSTAFLKHEHIGGEFYLILKEGIEDEHGFTRMGILSILIPIQFIVLGELERPWSWFCGLQG